MATLRLENGSDVIDLDEQWGSGLGYQSHAGATGLGLPDAEVQWFEGAGSGAIYRGRRVQSREIDLPISILTRSKEDLVERLDRLTMMLSAPFRIVRVDDEGQRWVLEAVHAGGADYTTGQDTDGETEWHATLQLRSGWQAWRREGSESMALSPSPEGGEFPYGEIVLENTGSADAWPVFKVQGPGNNFEVRDPEGFGFKWTGSLEVGETLTIHTEDGRVTDQTGANRYGSLAAAPRMMPLKPGLNTMTVTMDGKATGPGGASIVKASETPRRTNWYPKPLDLAAAGSAINVRSNLAPNPGAVDFWGWHAESYTSSSVVGTQTRDSSDGWPAASPTPVRGTSGFYNRAHLVKAHPNGTSFVLFSGNAVNPGGKVTLSAYVKTRLTVDNIRVVVRSSTTFSGTTIVQETYHPFVTTPDRSGEWVRISVTVDNYPGAYIRLGARVNRATVLDWVDMTEVLIEPVPELRPYMDGTTGDIGGGVAYGVTRHWQSTAHRSASHLRAPAATGWTASNYAKVFKWANTIVVYSCGDSGRVVGPNVSHTSGTPWVGSVWSTASGPNNGKVGTRFSIQSATTNSVAARSAIVWPKDGGQRVTASGGGALIKDATTNVRPVIEHFSSGVATYHDLLMEKSTNLGAPLDGNDPPHIDHGVHEWAGTENNSISHEYDAKWERSSLTTVEFQPRRWAVL